MTQTVVRVVLMGLAVLAITFAGCSHGDDGGSDGGGDGGYAQAAPSAEAAPFSGSPPAVAQDAPRAPA